MRITRIGDCTLRFLDARAAADWVVARLRTDPSIILPAPATGADQRPRE